MSAGEALPAIRALITCTRGAPSVTHWRKFLSLWGVAIAALWLTACSEESTVPKPPLVIPFALDKGGEVVEFEVRIVERQTYTFGLGFSANVRDRNDSERVLKLVGDPWKDASGRYLNLGEPLRIRLKIDSAVQSGGEFAFDQSTAEIARYSMDSNGYNKQIANVLLDPGHYKVRIENLQPAPAVRGTPVNVHVRRAYLGK
jgi:hypothetical protein